MKKKGEKKMNIYFWYRYMFADGYFMVSRGLSPQEIEQQESEHGKLIRTTYEGRY